MGGVALFGGRFDPIHIGHLIVAQDAAEALGVDRVLFLPTWTPPHKPAHAPYEHRLEMIRLAVNAVTHLDVSDAERQFGLSPSYTVDVLERLLPELSGDPVYFLMGSDEFQHIRSWHRHRDLFRLVRVAVLKRPFFDIEPFPEAEDRVIPLHRREIELSSSEVRRRIREGRPIRFLVPDAVADYLERTGLYRP